MVNGVDYVNLGYQTGGSGLINVMVNDFTKLYRTDALNTPVDLIPMMDGIERLSDMDLILDLSSGSPGIKEWVQFAGDRTGVPVAGGVTAVQAPLMYPYYPRQMFGVLGGMKAAAEYESLLNVQYGEESETPRLVGDACESNSDCTGSRMCSNQHCLARSVGIERMGPQTFAHMTIILFILVGNIAFIATRGRSGARRAKTTQES
jgi:hypothetical protein